MTADAKQMESLARIEHKLDLLLRIESFGTKRYETLIKRLNDINYCPVCEQLIEHKPDIIDAVVVRKCGCSTGKIALDMKAFAPPVEPARKNKNGNEQEDSDFNTDSSTRRPNR